MLSEALERSGCNPRCARVLAFGHFTQLFDRLPYLALRHKNRSKVQPRLREIRAQLQKYESLY